MIEDITVWSADLIEYIYSTICHNTSKASQVIRLCLLAKSASYVSGAKTMTMKIMTVYSGTDGTSCCLQAVSVLVFTIQLIWS